MGLEVPYTEDVICPRCETHFGFDDKIKTHTELRKAWVKIERLRYVYNIDSEFVKTLLKLQNNCCAICNASFESSGKKVVIDHDHGCCNGIFSCGKCVRGALCPSCNLLVGFVENGKAALVPAYLTNPPAMRCIG